jgi:hypothetical protein
MEIDRNHLPEGGPGAKLRERYGPYSLFAAVPQLALSFELELAVVDRLLDDDELFRLVRDDLARNERAIAAHERQIARLAAELRVLFAWRSRRRRDLREAAR